MIYTRQYLLLFLLLSKSAVANQPSDEYALKAAFIYNFTKYIDWNAKAAGDEFIIGVIGNSDILGPLRTIAGVKLVNGKKILLRHYSMIDHYEFCHVVFISKNADQPLEQILQKTSGKGTLIISEKEGAAQLGAVINFVNMNNTIRFEINTRLMDAAGLKASSQLLKLAIIIN